MAIDNQKFVSFASNVSRFEDMIIQQISAATNTTSKVITKRPGRGLSSSVIKNSLGNLGGCVWEKYFQFSRTNLYIRLDIYSVCSCESMIDCVILY